MDREVAGFPFFANRARRASNEALSSVGSCGTTKGCGAAAMFPHDPVLGRTRQRSSSIT